MSNKNAEQNPFRRNTCLLYTSVPIVLLFLLVDKHLIGGLTAGSVRQ